MVESMRLYLSVLALLFILIIAGIFLSYLYSRNAELDSQYAKLQSSKREEAEVVTLEDVLKTLSANFKLNDLSYTVTGNSVNIQFSALEEQEVYRMIAYIKQHFPGQIFPKKLSVDKVGKPDDGTINQIKQGQRPDLVRGEFIFEWASINQ